MTANVRTLIVTLSFLASVFVLVFFGRISWELGAAFMVSGLPIILVELRKPETKEESKNDTK